MIKVFFENPAINYVTFLKYSNHGPIIGVQSENLNSCIRRINEGVRITPTIGDKDLVNHWFPKSVIEVKDVNAASTFDLLSKYLEAKYMIPRVMNLRERSEKAKDAREECARLQAMPWTNQPTMFEIRRAEILEHPSFDDFSEYDEYSISTYSYFAKALVDSDCAKFFEERKISYTQHL